MITKRLLTGAGVLALLLVLMLASSGCTGTTPPGNVTTAPADTGAGTPVPTTYTGPRTDLLIATTTSLEDTGLLDYLTPFYEATHPVNLKITSQGTGRAIELAKSGDADLLLVHSPSQETAFMEAGNGVNRRSFAYNYFIIVGPESDPAGIAGLTPEDAFLKLMDEGKKGTQGVAFVSRGDNSGTHSAEKTIWKNAKMDYATQVQKSGDWYIEAGKGMGETLQLANEKDAYTLSDEGTYLAYKGNLELVPIISEGKSLLNIYSGMSVIPKGNATATLDAANDYINFLISPDTQAKIAEFGKEQYGKNLFNPMTAEKAGEFKVDSSTPATATKPVLVYAAGSLASPFAKVKKVFDANNTGAELGVYTAASVTAIEKVTKKNQPGDVVASADAYLIPKLMFPENATWMLSFASNAMVIAFSNSTSDYAGEITAENWFEVLDRENVSYAINDPTTDPGGYRSFMTILLAEGHYGEDEIFENLVGDHSSITATKSGAVTTIDVSTPSPDGTTLVIPKAGEPGYIDQLKAGTVDYIFTYRSNAVQNGLAYLTLPPEIDLSDTAMEDTYAKVVVKRPDGSTEEGMPITYGVTVPTVGRNPDLGEAFVKILTGPEGAAILSAEGFIPITPATPTGPVPVGITA
ncbi:MAG: tungstate ABC transporter substrate-binding protein WtpA [Methanospirillum sp.]|nr:tungstate ABC transporter substrate-binding protein WtpA [Methanospirillum sp.]